MVESCSSYRPARLRTRPAYICKRSWTDGKVQFEGARLAAILEGQSDRVGIFDSTGHRSDVPPGVALKIASGGRFVGIGHGRRIRSIRPPGVGLQWGGGSTTRPVRADGTGKYYGVGQLMGNPR